MNAFHDGPATVEVPATSANLGPGFDCLGLALELTDTLVGEVLDAGLEIEVDGEGAAEVPRDESHLVVRAMRAAFAAMDHPAPGLRLRCTNRIPHSRGLGSSSAAIVGGIVLARALVADPGAWLDDDAVLTLANRIEGHPDNVAPALLGGLVVSGQAGGAVWAQQAPIAESVCAVVAIPPHGVRTEVARGLLPETLPYADAVANSGRTALLVTALGGPADLLLRATEDFVHQGYRRPAMPDSITLVEDLRGRGIPAVVSGAGPTVLAFAGLGGDDASTLEDVRGSAPADWRTMPVNVRRRGACVLT